MIDLHTHSSRSDGTDAPAELLRQAVEGGLTTLAITDHDGLYGIVRFAEAAEQTGLAVTIVTQFCFDAPAIMNWIKRLRALGLEHPVRIGMAGPASFAALIAAEHVLVRVTLSDGSVGVAEATPRPTIYGETPGSVTAMTTMMRNMTTSSGRSTRLSLPMPFCTPIISTISSTIITGTGKTVSVRSISARTGSDSEL